MKLRILVLGLAAMLGIATAASASTIWTFENVSLTRTNAAGAVLATVTVSGSFTYDGSTSSITDWDVLLSGDASLEFKKSGPPAQGYTISSSTDFYFTQGAPGQSFNYINFDLVSALIDTAAPTNIYLLGDGTNVSIGQNTFFCSSACTEQQQANSAYITNQGVGSAATVPEPATLSLLGLGLGLGVRKLRSRKK